jgi:hypothetical protein
MGVHQAKAAQASEARTLPSEIRQRDLPCVADDHVLDLSTSIDQHADLAPDSRGSLGEGAGELRTRHPVWRYTPSVQSLEGIELARRQAEGIAVDHAGPSQRG